LISLRVSNNAMLTAQKPTQDTFYFWKTFASVKTCPIPKRNLQRRQVKRQTNLAPPHLLGFTFSLLRRSVLSVWTF